ncbi:hypothetical protein [Tahibacter harae]|uniref:Uncharacterized protein n=1 Tax=Tahibacter harae TaxID=2963937 RepID=A0ABT1QX95_9GAMM|nr:hypothetical protein [Tahibacter harae]MCQ4166906.1 hypothetical protein [Tahibacter harae]
MNPRSKTGVLLCSFLATMLPAAPASANVIFPAFAAPYLAPVIAPWLIAAVLAIETAVLLYRERHLQLGGAFFLTLLTNVVSWIAGMLLAATVFPSGIVHDPVRPGPQFGMLLWFAFPAALVLSILIEAAVLKLFARWLGLRTPLQTMLIANAASYLPVALVLLVPGLR